MDSLGKAYAQLFGGAPGGAAAAMSFDPAMLRAANGRVVRELKEIAEEAAPGAQVVVQYRYEVGPDGKLYAVGGAVSYAEKVERPGSREPFTPLPNGFGDLAKPGFSMSSQDMAETYGLSDEEAAVVRELQGEDAAVRAHEALHFRAAGGLAQGGPDFTYVRGPDGVYYAVGGAVDVHAPATADPEKQARDARALSNAATAPGDASAADLLAARRYGAQAAAGFGRVEDPFFAIAA